ncbi:MAG TPA: ABC transporter ATP-binding protein [Euzebyales bacterium]|nr:ABC transporter ATP-binding protein [Euzebyales bacterium]
MGVDTETAPRTAQARPEGGGPQADAGSGLTTTRAHVMALLPVARDDAGRYVLSAVLATAATLCQLGPFYVMYLAVRDLLGGRASWPGMRTLAVWALVAVVGHYTLLALSTLISHRAAFRTLYRLRLRVGQRLGRVPLGEVTGRRSGEIQRTLSDDVERLESFLAHAVPDLTAAVVVVAVTTGWMLAVDWRMALAAMSCLAVAVLLSTRAMRRSQDLLGEHMVAMARMNGSLVEMVRGLDVVRTFNRSGGTFAEARDAVRSAAEFQADWGRRFLPLFTGFFTLAASPAVTVVPVGLLLWAGDSIATAELLFFFVLALGYGGPVVRLLLFIADLSPLSYGARLVHDLEEAPELPEATQAAAIRDGSVAFRDVSFRYQGSERDALADVSFRAAPRTITALVGPSGAGKSTVARLICRFYDVDAGCVLVGDVDVRDIPFSQLMSRVSFVFQDTFLFDDSIAANLRLARPGADAAELERACRAARAHEFIAALPEGYATRIGEHGARLSGGQRQRLAIARTLLKGTDIVVLDEATAFADADNEVALQEAINALVADRTVIVIAHRLSTVAGADQILVVDGGRIRERGRHDELVAAGGLYARMWQAFEESQHVALGEAVHDDAREWQE